MEKEKDELLNPDDFEEETETEDDGKSNEDEETENQSSTEESNNESAKSQKEKTDEEQKRRNSEYARKRREQEENERKKHEEELRKQIEKEVKLGMYKTNPYTNEPIKDEEDIRQYEIQKALDDEGKDPIHDYPKRVAELNRKEKAEAKKKQEQEQKEQENLKKDLMDFKEKYPDVDLRQLADDDSFIEFSEGKSGRWTTAEIYEAYQVKKEMDALKNKKNEIDKEAEQKAKNITKTPSANGSKSNTKTDIDRMSAEEFTEYLKNKYH